MTRPFPVDSQLIRAVQAEGGRRWFRNFIRMGWPTVEPARPFIPNWHIDAIADHLQAVSEGHIKRLLITVPPGHAKSLVVSVLWPVWQWLRDPGWRGLFASYDTDLAIRDSVRCRSLLASDWFQETFQPRWNFSGDQNEKSWFENDRKGVRMALGVGGKGTGFRGDCLVIDDPLNAKDRHSETALREVVDWFDQVMSTRLNDPTKGAIVIVMQRLSERDLADHVMRRGGYECLSLATEFEPQRRCVTSIWRDPRTEAGELLFPQLFPASAIVEAKETLGAQGFATQHQQRPAPAEGGIFKRHWWRFWRPKNGANLPAIHYTDADGVSHEAVVVVLPGEMDEGIQSWDCSFKDTRKSDFVAGELWGRLGADAYLLDQVHGRMGFPDTLTAIRNMTKKWPAAEVKLIEDAANGSAAIQTLAHEMTGIIAVKPLGGKESRAHAVSPRIESGNVYLPHPGFCPWVNDFIEECANFPNGLNDDWVDAMTQALARLSSTRQVVVQPTPVVEDEPYFF